MAAPRTGEADDNRLMTRPCRWTQAGPQG